MNTNRIFISLPIILFSIVLTACGGGGGGDGPPPITYTGSSTPANIDSTNAKELSGGATQLGEFGGAGLTAAVDTGSQQKKSGTSILSQAAVKAINNKLNAELSSTATIHNFSETMQGTCGGSLSSNLDADDALSTLSVSGTLRFNDYCENGATISGQFNLSGSVNASVTSMNFTMSTSSILIRDNASSDVYKAENYALTVMANLNSSGIITSTTVSIKGRFYDPLYGYVLVTTPSVLHYSGSSAWPDSGSIKIAEDGGVNSATLSVYAPDPTQYQLEVNIGGKITTTTGNWAEL